MRDPLEAIPVSAFIVISTNDVNAAWATLNRGNLVWDAMNETNWASAVSKVSSLTDSLLTANPEISGMINGRPCWISLHATGKNNFDYVVTTSLPSAADKDDFISFLNKSLGTSNKIGRSEWNKTMLLDIEAFKGGRFFAACREGVIAFSSNEELLKAGMDQLDKGPTLKSDKNFVSLKETAEEKSLANVYWNYQRLFAAMDRVASDDGKEKLDDAGNFAEWSESDIDLQPNAVMMNGYTATTDSAKEYLSTMSGQTAQAMQIDEVLPSSTISFVDYGISNIDDYFLKYDAYLDHLGIAAQRDEQLAQLHAENNFDPKINIGSWLGNEIAVAQVPDSAGGTTAVAFLSTTNTTIALEKLGLLTGKEDTVEITAADSSGCVIRKNPAENMLPATFGSLFSELSSTYYCVIRNCVVFAKEEKMLHGIFLADRNNHTLKKNRTYADFISNISPEANLTFYFSPGNFSSTLKRYAATPWADDLTLHDKLIRRFDGAIIQFSTGDNDKGLFYTSIFFRHNPQEKKSMSTLWETQLDTTFSSRPYMVHDHKTKGLDIFVQDDANTIYLISSAGNIIWKRKLSEKMLGEVKQVDALKNDKYQLAFNTASFLYIIDRNGKDIEHFPVRLPATATNSVAVIDYDNTREYRMLVACSDKKIYNYGIDGKKVDGWKTYSTNDIVLTPLQRTIISSHDYVIAVDRSGQSYITERQGNTRLVLNGKLNAPVKKYFLENGKDLAHSYLVDEDSSGNVAKLSLTDVLEHLHFSDFHSSPDMEYRDVNGDGSREYIFLDEKDLTVYNREKQPVTAFTFPEKTNVSLMIFGFDEKDIRFGILCPGKNEVHLVNNGGSESEGFPLEGETPFSIGKLNGNDAYTLVCGNNGRYVCAYAVK